MVEVLAVILAVLVVFSFVVLALFAVAGVSVSALTVLRARREQRLADELDQVLEGILGPRSGSSYETTRSRNARHWIR